MVRAKADPVYAKRLRDEYVVRHSLLVKERKARNRRARNDQYRQYWREWRASNKGRVAAYTRERQIAKSHASPEWLTAIQEAQILEFYEIADALTTQTGVKHHVDHIHPIRGKNFRGLHVPWNLQVLTAKENLAKHTRLLDPSIAMIGA